MEDKNFESERRGDYDSNLTYLYHNYEPDKKIPWVRYILFYLVLLTASLALFYRAWLHVPVKGSVPYEEPVIIDKMGYFTDTENIKAELEILQENIGHPVDVISIPIDEYETKTGQNTYYMIDVYNYYYSDEDHVLIYITSNDYRYIVELRTGDNVKHIFEDADVAYMIESRIHFEDSITQAFIDGLKEGNTALMKLYPVFFVFLLAGIALIGTIVVHSYVLIIKRIKKEKERHYKIK